MKCNRYAIWGWKSKKSMVKFTPIVLGSIPENDISKLGYKIPFFNKLELCEGGIISQIELEWIPYMGGADANIEIRFVCNKCLYEFAGNSGLPHDLGSLNKFMTKVIKDI